MSGNLFKKVLISSAVLCGFNGFLGSGLMNTTARAGSVVDNAEFAEAFDKRDFLQVAPSCVACLPVEPVRITTNSGLCVAPTEWESPQAFYAWVKDEIVARRATGLERLQDSYLCSDRHGKMEFIVFANEKDSKPVLLMPRARFASLKPPKHQP